MVLGHSLLPFWRDKPGVWAVLLQLVILATLIVLSQRAQTRSRYTHFCLVVATLRLSLSPSVHELVGEWELCNSKTAAPGVAGGRSKTATPCPAGRRDRRGSTLAVASARHSARFAPVVPVVGQPRRIRSAIPSINVAVSGQALSTTPTQGFMNES